MFSYDIYRDAQNAHAWLIDDDALELHRPPVTYQDCLQVLDLPGEIIRKWLRDIRANRLVASIETIKAEVLNGRW